jgi:DNA primase
MEKVLAYYGLDARLSDGWTPVKCPFHDDSTASASASTTGFRCHTCGVKGDGIALIMERENIEFGGAVERYESITGDSVHRVSQSVQRKSWGIPPFGEKDRPLSDRGFKARVRRKPFE